MNIKNIIKFKQGELSELKARLFENKDAEFFGILLAKTEKVADLTIIKVIDIRIPFPEQLVSKSLTHVKPDREFIYQCLLELKNRFDVDTIIDVHTHPFSENKVFFSSVDDKDEINFFMFLNKEFEELNYSSIVFSQSEYSARVYKTLENEIYSEVALIKTQTQLESINSSDFEFEIDNEYESLVLSPNGFLNRSALAIGLDVSRKIMNNEVITIVGVGGLGSIVAENLIQMGFHKINLIDHDKVEFSNLNRLAGAYYDDAKNNRYKVDVVKRHLININPEAKIKSFINAIEDKDLEIEIATSDWIIVCTDNHSSRFISQNLAIKFFIPLISVGVNITVKDNIIEDMSGEVITSRVGDNLCLNCLGRINYTKMAYESHPNASITNEILKKGYIEGKDVKEPAVKTLNSILSAIATDILVNQYTNHQLNYPIWVYENNITKSIYKDTESVENRNKMCFTCCI